MNHRLFLVSLLALATGAGLVLACSSQNDHLFLGRYLAPSGCLDPTSAVDIVSGSDVSANCGPTCLVQNLGGPDGSSVYVSTMCPPYPFGYDTTGTDPACATALAAFGRDDTCLDDGGSSAPAPVDAGATDAGATDN